MFDLRRLTILLGLLLVILAPAALAQEEETPAEPAPDQEVVVDVPQPAVEVVEESPAEVEQPWTFRYLIPTSLVIAVLVVVGSIVAYFLKVVRTRYRLIQ